MNINYMLYFVHTVNFSFRLLPVLLLYVFINNLFTKFYASSKMYSSTIAGIFGIGFVSNKNL